MHKELRYQVKTHAISDMPREFFLKKMQYGKKNIICKARSNLMMPIQKNNCSTCFFCLPLTNTCKVLSREIGGKNTIAYYIAYKI